MSDPHNPGKIGVTIKVPESKKYAGDNPWFVFEGTDPQEIKARIAATFSIEHEGLNLGAVVINAQRHVTGLGAVAHGLGGTVLSTGTTPAWEAPTTAANGSADVWSQAAAAQGGQAAAPATVADPILVAIEQAKTVDELKQIWAENQAAFADAKYMDPWKAKGQALSKPSTAN